MKKLFTLFAFLAVFLGAKAEWVEVFKVDYSQFNGFPYYVMGYVPEWVDGVMTDLGGNYKYGEVKDDATETSDIIVSTQGGDQYYRLPATDGTWHQYFIADQIPTELDGSFVVKAMVKASEAVTINVNMGWGWKSGEQTSANVSIGTEWAEVEWEYSGIGGTSCNLVAQPNTAAQIEWKWLTVTQNKKETRPVEWLELLTSDGTPEGLYMGNAETPWPDPNVQYNDKEKNYLVCAWGKEKGRNLGEPNADGNIPWNPFPCDIEQEADGNHVFVVHGQIADTQGDASAWDNQFWIEAPRMLKVGSQFKIHFRYKASENATTNTQYHHQNPSDYVHWQALGDVNFTTEWQDFDGIFTVPNEATDAWSIAFNLNPQNKNAVNFYFDDLSMQVMKLDEGLFVASSNSATGLEYDFDNATEFVFDEDLQAYVATVGTPGKQDSWVNEVMISTVRGNDAAFKSSTLKPAGTVVNDPEVWPNYTESSLAKIRLPAAGVWTIAVDTKQKQMNFVKLEGEEDHAPLVINPNPTLVTINALERDFTSAEQEGGTGQAWDNQFWIVSNRPLTPGETTIVQFKYKSAIPAKASTQSHEQPGNYIHYAAIGDVNFTEEWQDFENTFTVPSECDGSMADGGYLKNLQSIAFNLSEIKDANTYELKDFVWKLEDGTESLINQTGSENFFVKILGGSPQMFDDGTGIKSVVNFNTVSTATYNLAGQRVSKDYKGIVVKNGRKMLAK